MMNKKEEVVCERLKKRRSDLAEAKIIFLKRYLCGDYIIINNNENNHDK